MAQSPDERPATAAKLGDELQQNRRRNDLSVDNMALPTDTADEPDYRFTVIFGYFF